MSPAGLSASPHPLLVVVDALARLAGAEDPATSIPDALAIVGAGLGADRVFVYENGPETSADGAPVTCAIRHEWVAEGVVPQLGKPGFGRVHYADILGPDVHRLVAGDAVFVDLRDARPALKDLHGAAPAACFLLLPLRVRGELWGVIGFDWMRLRRPSAAEDGALRALAFAVGSVLGAHVGSQLLHAVFASFELSTEGLAIIDPEWRVTHMNSALKAKTGCGGHCDLDALLGDCFEGADPDRVRAVCGAGRQWQGQVRCEDGDGIAHTCVLTVRPVPKVGYLAGFADVTALHQSRAQLHHELHHDALTGLPNRREFEARLSETLAHARRNGTRVGVLFIDLDGFKTVNDSLGHSQGDGLLVAWARRLAGLIGPTDPLFRIGGDEFAVLLLGRRTAADLEHACGLLLGASRDTFGLPSGAAVYATASMGLAVFPDDDATGGADAFLGYADAALFRAKARGRNRVQRYDPVMTRSARRRLQLEGELRVAVESGQLEVWMQPQFDLADGRLMGAEALLRWPREDGRFISPGEFVPLAEETGLIVPITEQILQAVCQSWGPLTEAAGRMLCLSINVSPSQFHRHDVTTMLREALSRWPIPEGGLEVELTESALMLAPETMARRLDAVRELGVRIGIDDFGTGYSSLSALRRYPLDWLKIDRSFVRDLPDEPGALAIAETILAMAGALGLRTMAEGVETEAQLAALRARGCTGFQGFLRSGAVPIPALREGILADPERGGFGG